MKTQHANSPRFLTALWDRLGVFSSGLCLIDCLVLPIASTVLIGFQASVPWVLGFHTLVLPIIALAASFAFYHSFKAHRSYGVVIVGVLGIFFLFVGELWEENLRPNTIHYASLVGSLFLIAAHTRNLLLHSRHRACAHH